MARKKSRPLSRRTGVRSPKKTVYVFCEGEKTERDYLRALRRADQVVGKVHIDVDSDAAAPKDLVERAIKKIKDPEVDECWCIFDVEAPVAHPNIESIVRTAEKHGVRLAVTNPCFELWLVLHHRNVTRYVTTTEIVKQSKEIDGRGGKGIDGSLYMKNLDQAGERADKLRQRHLQDGTTFPNDNPSSGMVDFVRAVGAVS